MRSIFRALENKNYRIFFCGQSISLIGTWMQQVAMSWLVYRMTNSVLLLGVVGFVGQIPTFLLTPFAGVLADRYNRHRILIITQALAMIQAFVLAILVFTNNIEVWQLLILSLFLGIVSSFDIPVRQAFTIELIDKKEDMGNAIALNSSIVNLARLIGPSIAGILIAVSGEAVCFLCNAISYIPAIAALLAMKIVQRNIKPPVNHVLHDLKEGFMYAFNFIPIRAILLLLCLVSLMAMPYQVLMPVFARDIFHGGPKTLGYLMAMAGAGALAGAMYLAARKSVVGLGKIIAESSMLFGVSIAVFSFSRWFWLSMIIICVAGFSMMVQMAASNTILQTIVEEDKRGRIMSFYTMAFIGMAPFGSLLAGGLANKIGVSHTLLIGGVCSIIGAIIFTRKLPLIREKIRPIYVKKGIIPEVVAGIGVVSELEK